MIASKADLIATLTHYNPWWRDGQVDELPKWQRAVFSQVLEWVTNPPAHRALLLSGARQVGKTTLLLQAVKALIGNGVPPTNILYATFDHPLIKLTRLDGLLHLWREIEPDRVGTEYLFLDEIQYTKDWQTWLKHQVDFQKHRHIVVTGSATPLTTEGQESGVGRWHTLQLATLSFYEYLQIKSIATPQLPAIDSLKDLFKWTPIQFAQVAEEGRSLVGHFHEYLLRGGFPQIAKVESIAQAQKLLREDIVDKVLKRDMTALFGVRRVLELEQTFLYLCLHDSGLLDMPTLCSNLKVNKPTANNFIALLENTHLIYRLRPFGYGKEILRARYKVYLADAAIAPSVMLKGKLLLEDSAALGVAVETAFFKHLSTCARYYDGNANFSYWHGKKDQEVDIIASAEGQHEPFEVKYRSQPVDVGQLKGMQQFCAERKVTHGYVITKEITDFGLLSFKESGGNATVLKIPAPLACYWLGRAEMEATDKKELMGTNSPIVGFEGEVSTSTAHLPFTFGIPSFTNGQLLTHDDLNKLYQAILDVGAKHGLSIKPAVIWQMRDQITPSKLNSLLSDVERIYLHLKQKPPEWSFGHFRGGQQVRASHFNEISARLQELAQLKH